MAHPGEGAGRGACGGAVLLAGPALGGRHAPLRGPAGPAGAAGANPEPRRTIRASGRRRYIPGAVPPGGGVSGEGPGAGAGDGSGSPFAAVPENRVGLCDVRQPGQSPETSGPGAGTERGFPGGDASESAADAGGRRQPGGRGNAGRICEAGSGGPEHPAFPGPDLRELGRLPGSHGGVRAAFREAERR